MFIRKRPFALLSLLFMIVLVTVYSSRQQQNRLQDARPYGRFTLRQALDRAEPLCRMLLINSETLLLSANE